MLLVDEGRLALDEPIARWLPELAHPVVVRTMSSPVDDVVPAERPITVEDLLTFRAGWGFPSDFSLPAVQPLFTELRQGPPVGATSRRPTPGSRRSRGSRCSTSPGEAWLYNTCSDVLGLLVERVTGTPFADVLAERIFEPLGMVDTAFWVPAEKRDRFTTAYRPAPDGGLTSPTGRTARAAGRRPSRSGAGGLV